MSPTGCTCLPRVGGHWERHCRSLGLAPIPVRRGDEEDDHDRYENDKNAGVMFLIGGKRELLVGAALEQAPEQALCWILAHEAGHHALHRPHRMADWADRARRYERHGWLLLILATAVTPAAARFPAAAALAVTAAAWLLYSTHRSRRAEYRADAYAAGLGTFPNDPEALAWLTPSKPGHRLTSLWSTHPCWADRVARMTRAATVRGRCPSHNESTQPQPRKDIALRSTDHETDPRWPAAMTVRIHNPAVRSKRLRWTDARGTGEGDLDALHRALAERHGTYFDTTYVHDITAGNTDPPSLRLNRVSVDATRGGGRAAYVLCCPDGAPLADLAVGD